jgi:hypothetical protein
VLLFAASRKRSYHLGPFPLEALPRDPTIVEREAARPPVAAPPPAASSGPLGLALRRYREILAPLASGEPAGARAAVPDDLARRAVDVKGLGYFMNASQVGICVLPERAWCVGAERDAHDRAVVVLVELPRVPERDNLAHAWAVPAAREAAELRAAEVAVCIARHIRAMGFAARADVPGHRRLDHERLAVLAGLAVRHGKRIANPFVGEAFALEEWDITAALSRPGEYDVLFSFTGGANRLVIEWIELLADEGVAARVEQLGYAGNKEENNQYRLNVPPAAPAGRYRLRASVRGDGGGDSAGEIYMIPAPG